jgi:hypothetical protein
MDLDFGLQTKCESCVVTNSSNNRFDYMTHCTHSLYFPVVVGLDSDVRWGKSAGSIGDLLPILTVDGFTSDLRGMQLEDFSKFGQRSIPQLLQQHLRASLGYLLCFGFNGAHHVV